MTYAYMESTHMFTTWKKKDTSLNNIKSYFLYQTTTNKEKALKELTVYWTDWRHSTKVVSLASTVIDMIHKAYFWITIQQNISTQVFIMYNLQEFGKI